jgi:putative DNA primase/helicase
MTSTTSFLFEVKGDINSHVYENFFSEGNGNWAVWDGAFYHYSGSGYWEVQEQDVVNSEVTRFVHSSYKIGVDKDTGIAVKQYAFRDPGKIDKAQKYSANLLFRRRPSETEARYICFKNGIYDLEKETLLPHDKKYMVTHRIDADYTVVNECPSLFREFIAKAYGEDKLDVVRAYTSFLLDPTAPYGYFIHLIGQSGTGKGTLLRFWQSMFNPSSISANPNLLAELNTTDKIFQQLNGKHIVTAPDVISDISKASCGNFYELVDNGELTGRMLYKSTTISKKWNVRIVLASVEHPRLPNSSNGWDRRCRVLQTLPRTGEQNPRLESMLAQVKGEVICWGLSMDRVDRDLTLIKKAETVETIQLKLSSSIAGDSARAFLDACVEVASDGREFISSSELYSYYKAFCLVAGYSAMSSGKFTGHVKSIIPKYFQARKSFRLEEDRNKFGKTPEGWLGLEIPHIMFEEEEGRKVVNPKYLTSGNLSILLGLEDPMPKPSAQELMLQDAEDVFGTKPLPAVDIVDTSTKPQTFDIVKQVLNETAQTPMLTQSDLKEKWYEGSYNSIARMVRESDQGVRGDGNEWRCTYESLITIAPRGSVRPVLEADWYGRKEEVRRVFPSLRKPKVYA